MASIRDVAASICKAPLLVEFRHPQSKNFADGCRTSSTYPVLPITTMKNFVRGGMVPAAAISSGYGVVCNIIFAPLAALRFKDCPIDKVSCYRSPNTIQLGLRGFSQNRKVGCDSQMMLWIALAKLPLQYRWRAPIAVLSSRPASSLTRRARARSRRT
jgi:hypothetical protein